MSEQRSDREEHSNSEEHNTSEGNTKDKTTSNYEDHWKPPKDQDILGVADFPGSNEQLQSWSMSKSGFKDTSANSGTQQSDRSRYTDAQISPRSSRMFVETTKNGQTTFTAVPTAEVHICMDRNKAK